MQKWSDLQQAVRDKIEMFLWHGSLTTQLFC